MDWVWLAQVAAVISAAATILGTFTIAVTALIYYRQLKSMTKARQLESILVILKYIDDIELRRARYFIYEHAQELKSLFDAPFSWENRKRIDEKVRQLSIDKVELHKIDLWINALNNISFLIKEEYAPSDVLDGLMKNTFLHCWHTFQPYIEHRRRGKIDTLEEPSMYAMNLEWVVKNKCKVKSSRMQRAT